MHQSIRPFTNWFVNLLLGLYIIGQRVVVWLFAPKVPHNRPLKNGKIAVIGAGISGIAAASHCVAHGWDVVIFESKKDVGGIWADVNSTSGLQIHSTLYRFFPDLVWKNGYPHQAEILDNVKRIWKKYRLQNKTRFATKVAKLERKNKENDDDISPSRWYINDDESEHFDAVIVAIGTCGKPQFAKVEGLDNFKGKVAHSSELDNLDVKGKRVVVIGGGASAVEAVETAIKKGSATCDLLTRSDKWIIPRNFFFEAVLSMFPGREILLSKLPEFYLRTFFYRELKDLSPRFGVHTSTPVVNSEFLDLLRSGKATQRRGEVVKMTPNGILFEQRDSSDEIIFNKIGKAAPKVVEERAKSSGGNGNKEIQADVVIMATGFERPIEVQEFVPERYVEAPFSPPNIYMQVFSVKDSSLMFLNCTFKNAVATAGHVHLGIYTRILLTFLGDPSTSPYPELMQVWVRFINLWKTSDPKSDPDLKNP
eukprot:TRINITY_DN6095_c0_g1_i2.p1 TRINITY_DN6095_c0_g1~~TRINITY_DN6095_c0_g1_i2.p1  ORF type:complete len:480 (-),score=174.90 TRINITY_DN6095_c0_g1_i2:108-1547(-)